MSKTAYFITDEQVEVLQGLLAEKIEADLDRCRLQCVCSDEEKEAYN